MSLGHPLEVYAVWLIDRLFKDNLHVRGAETNKTDYPQVYLKSIYYKDSSSSWPNKKKI